MSESVGWAEWAKDRMRGQSVLETGWGRTGLVSRGYWRQGGQKDRIGEQSGGQDRIGEQSVLETGRAEGQDW
jgi:hypothetical protein